MSKLFCVAAVACQLTWVSASAQSGPNLSPAGDLFNRVAGTWGTKDDGSTSAKFSCNANPHTISFSEGNRVANFTYAQSFDTIGGVARKQTTYRVLYSEANRITMYWDDETRRTENGDRVVWVLMLDDDDTYFWRRTDWGKGGRTLPFIRCKSG